MGTLRQFSTRRVIGFILMDWMGTLALLYLATRLSAVLIGLGLETGIELPDATLPGAIGATPMPLPSRVFGLVALLWPTFLLAFSVYDGRHSTTLLAELFGVLQAVGLAMVTLAGMLYLTHTEILRSTLVAFLALDVAALTGSRAALWGWRHAQRNPERPHYRNVLVIGAGPVGQNVVGQLRKYAWSRLNLLGYVDDDPEKQSQRYQGLPVLGTRAQVPELAKSLKIQDAVVALPLRAHEQLVEICHALQGFGVRVHVVPDLFALSFPNATLDGFGGIPVIALGQPGISGWRRFRKRAFDTVVASLMLILLLPVGLAIVILIKLDSPGAVIFKQERIGEHGRPFTMLKFRSMRQGADTGQHKAYVTRLIEQNLSPEQLPGSTSNSLKQKGDSRVTRIGRIIRKGSLDEIPQFINVLRGEMSLVGPRPPLDYEVAVYQDWHKRRLEALPGITGLWQVEGRNQVNFDEMVRLDIKYIEHQSLWLDVKILLQTPWTMLTGRGAG